MHVTSQDLRYAIRQLIRHPGFTAIAVLTLGLGIGANTALFSVVDGVLLEPLPFPQSDRLVALTRPTGGEADMSVPDAVDLREATSAFDEIAPYLAPWNFDLTGEGPPEQLTGAVVGPEYFRALGVRPLLGRTITPADDRRGGERVAVISEGFWRRRLGADPAVVGRTITLSDHPLTIIGVAPDRFDFLQAGLEVWVPIAVEAPWTLDNRGTNNYEAIARLEADATLDQANSELKTVSERLAGEYPNTNQGKVLTAVRLRDFLVGDVRPALILLLAAVGLVLLIACVNLANLLLVRSARREHEIAICLTLGGDRARVARGLLIESLVVAVAGAALGILIASLGTDVLVRLAPAGLPRIEEIGLNGRALGFTAGLSLLTGLLFGLVPAMHIAHGAPSTLLRGGGLRASAGRERRRLLNVFVVSQVALAFVLLVGAGLLIRSFRALRHIDLGFEPRHLVLANLVLPESRYGEPDRQTAAFRSMVESLEEEPGVERAAFVIGAPLLGMAIGHAVLFDDRPPPEPGQQAGARNRPVIGDYFRTMGIPILRGRGLDWHDDANAPRVAVVNEIFANQYWPDGSPIGKRIAWQLEGQKPSWMTVVGVASDVTTFSMRLGDGPTVYTSYLQREEDWQRFGTIVARTRTDPAEMATVVRDAVWSVDPDVPVATVATGEQLIRGALARDRFDSRLVAVFGLVALLIAVQGIYGVLSYAVTQRRNEIGVRIALGAQRRHVLRTVLRTGAILTLTGLTLGAVVALLLSRFLSDLLFGVQPTDAISFLAVAATVGVTALLAAYLPALRATRVDPVQALRYE